MFYIQACVYTRDLPLYVLSNVPSMVFQLRLTRNSTQVEQVIKAI
jgi:tellurite resistance-related uncharacterized protein